MNKEKKWMILWACLYVLQVAAQIAAAVYILDLGLIPEGYSLLLILALAGAAVLTGLLLFLPGKKALPVRRLIAGVLACVLAVGSVAACAAASTLRDTLDEITRPPQTAVVVGIYGLKDSGLSLEELKTASLGRVEDHDGIRIDYALQQLKEELGTIPQTKQYPSVTALVDALRNGEVRAIILNSAFVTILEEIEGYSGFSGETRVIHYIGFAEPEKPTEPTDPTDPPTEPPATPPTEAPTDPTDAPTDPTDPPTQPPTEPTEPGTELAITQRPFIIYLSGSDTRDEKLTLSRSDVNLLLVVNPVTRQILMINTPRDTYVANPLENYAMDKLTHCGIYGVRGPMKALEYLYGHEVDYFSQINFTGFATLVDAIGGITVYSEESFVTLHGDFTIEKGYNHLNGLQALGFARERYSLSGGDHDRGQNHMKVMAAILDKFSAKTIVSNYTAIMESLRGMFCISVPDKDLADLVKFQISEAPQWDIKTFAISGSSSNEETFSMPGMKLYVMLPNMDHVQQASQLIGRVMAGEVLSDEDLIH